MQDIYQKEEDKNHEQFGKEQEEDKYRRREV